MNWTDQEISAWLEEQLSVERMAALEQQLRTDEALQLRVTHIIRERDQAGHSIGEIWQRFQVSCPTRSELGGYLLGTLSPEACGYIDFHLQTVGCRLCLANLNDLQEQSTSQSGTPQRRRRFFESSAGLLRPEVDSDSGFVDRR
ncbi:MAG: hypothetical protein KDA96_04485 [Planctomycetaceae bacterium]|nr:hypothetical protein [Planctomycetaceae bacterium]